MASLASSLSVSLRALPIAATMQSARSSIFMGRQMTLLSVRGLSSRANSPVLSVPEVATASSGSDNGANNCLASHLGAMRHSSTEQAIANLVSRASLFAQEAHRTRSIGVLQSQSDLGKGQPAICGHGDDGFLTTGAGQNDQQTNTNTIGTWNEYEWGPHFDRLKGKNYVMFTIYSCNTGAGSDGADLLYNMARRTNHAVRARTGLTSCGSGGITFQEGSTWQIATPDNKPNPIPAPPHFRMVLAKAINFKGDGGMVTVRPDEIKKVEISKSAPYTGSKTQVTLDKIDDINVLLENIDFSAPVSFGAESGNALLGIITSKISIFTESTGKTRTFHVYNNSVLQDTDFPDVYYQVLPGFKGLLARLS